MKSMFQICLMCSEVSSCCYAKQLFLIEISFLITNRACYLIYIVLLDCEVEDNAESLPSSNARINDPSLNESNSLISILTSANLSSDEVAQSDADADTRVRREVIQFRYKSTMAIFLQAYLFQQLWANLLLHDKWKASDTDMVVLL